MLTGFVPDIGLCAHQCFEQVALFCLVQLWANCSTGEVPTGSKMDSGVN